MALLPFKNGHLHYHWLPGNPALKPLVLLHGFLEDSRMWDGLSQAWNTHGPVLMIDLPGHGQSDSFAAVHTMELMAEAVDAVVQFCQLPTFHLLGHSMGGYVALAYAETHPEKLEQLGLFFSTPLADSPARQVMREKAAALVQQNHNAFIRASIPQLFDATMRAAFQPAIHRQIDQSLEMSVEGIVAAIQGMKIRKDRTHILEGGTVPVGVFAGKLDTVIPFDSVEKWSLATGVNYRYTSPSGHMGHITHQQGCIDEVQRWWLGA